MVSGQWIVDSTEIHLTSHYARNTIRGMRYAVGHKRQTSERILRAAGKLFRKKGYAATGVDAVMKSADLTAGAFYSHFRSKEDLLAEVLDTVFRESKDDRPEELSKLRGHAWLRAFASFYLSKEHRDNADRGCPMPALAAEVGKDRRKATRSLRAAPAACDRLDRRAVRYCSSRSRTRDYDHGVVPGGIDAGARGKRQDVVGRDPAGVSGISDKGNRTSVGLGSDWF